MQPIPKAKKVIVFNTYKKFAGMFVSATQTARALGKHTPSINKACVGDGISCNNLYFRYLPPHLSIEDVASMDLPTFDKLNGLKRKLYATSKMTRKGMKYNKQK